FQRPRRFSLEPSTRRRSRLGSGSARGADDVRGLAPIGHERPGEDCVVASSNRATNLLGRSVTLFNRVQRPNPPNVSALSGGRKERARKGERLRPSASAACWAVPVTSPVADGYGRS